MFRFIEEAHKYKDSKECPCMTVRELRLFTKRMVQTKMIGLKGVDLTRYVTKLMERSAKQYGYPEWNTPLKHSKKEIKKVIEANFEKDYSDSIRDLTFESMYQQNNPKTMVSCDEKEKSNSVTNSTETKIFKSWPDKLNLINSLNVSQDSGIEMLDDETSSIDKCWETVIINANVSGQITKERKPTFLEIMVLDYMTDDSEL